MGGSGWFAFAPYQSDIQAALDTARERAFADQDYYWPYDADVQRPTSLEDFWLPDTTEEQGAHSVIDAERIIDDRFEGWYDTLCLPYPEDVLAMFGTDRPTRAAFDSPANVGDEGVHAVIPDANCGCYLVLYREGQPDEIAFWGYSGD